MLSSTFWVVLGVAAAFPTSDNVAGLGRRQLIDLDLADITPDPTNSTASPISDASIVDAVIADIYASPLPQKRSVDKRDISGYTSSVSLGNAAINAPLNCKGADTYMGAKLWSVTTLNELRCATACTAQSEYNLKHPPANGLPKTCQFYNTYLLLKNGEIQGQYCSLYTQAWDVSKATNSGQKRGSDIYTISQSIIASNATNTGDVSCPQDVPYLSANGQDFCTAYINYIEPIMTSTAILTPAISTVNVIETSLITSVSLQTSTSTQTSIATSVITVAAGNKRDIQTPSSVSTWAPSRISAACSAVATGTTSTTITSTAQTPLVSQTTTTSETTITTSTVITATTTTLVSITTTSASYMPTETVNWNTGFEEPYYWKNNQNGGRISDKPNVYEGTYGNMILPNWSKAMTVPANLTLTETVYGLNPSSNLYGLSWYQNTNVGVSCTLSITLGGVSLYTKTIQSSENAVYNRDTDKYSFVHGEVDFITPPSATADLQFIWFCPDVTSNGRIYLDNIELTSGVAVQQ